MKKRKLWISLVVLLVAALATPIAAILVLFNRYVQTDYVSAAAASQRFAMVRSQILGVSPVLEYRDFDSPIVHRRPGSVRRVLKTLHVLAYSAQDEELRRADIPVSVIRAATFNGRMRLMDLGFLGRGKDDRLTLADLERHGPGVVVDTTTAHGGRLTIGNTVPAHTDASRLLVWLD